MRRVFSYRINIVLAGLCMLCAHVFAQKPVINFRHISYNEGLYQNTIASVMQDKSGYVWIGSWNGLTRYDGVSFKNFRKNDFVVTTISHNRINEIYEDKAGELWIATSGGLNLYNKLTEQFTHIGVSTAKDGGDFISALQEDDQGRLWVSTFKGIKFVNKGQKKLSTVDLWAKQHEDQLLHGVSFSLLKDDQKTMWAGVRQGLKRFDPNTGKILALPAVVENDKDLKSAKIIMMRQDPSGDIWFATEENGLFRYSPKSNSCINYTHKEGDPNSLPSNWLNDILVKDGNLWIATRNGLSIFDVKQGKFFNYLHDSADYRTIDDNSIWSLTADKTGNVWIGTYSGSIDVYYPGNANFSNIGERIGNNVGLNKRLVNALSEDANGGLWVGTFNGGLNYIDRKNGISNYYDVNNIGQRRYSNEVKSIADDERGNLWLGTLDGLSIFNKASKTLKAVDLATFNTNKGRGGRLINALVKDSAGIWVGINGDGLRYVNFSGQNRHSFYKAPGQTNSLSDNFINALQVDKDYIWIATQNGLNRLDKTSGAFKVYRRVKRKGLGDNNVLSLYKDKRGWLWIGTDGGGLNCLDIATDKIYKITKADGLPDDIVMSITQDNAGKIWISTNNQISGLTIKPGFPATPHSYLLTNYSAANGMLGNQFINNAALHTKSGELLFGGMNGITAFYPGNIITNDKRPDILLTSFEVKNKEVPFGSNSALKTPINETSNITLPYSDNNITIRFSALNFINPDKNQYAYKMTGITKNDTWQEIGNQKEISFSNLDFGEYVFWVKAANNDGVWNDTGRKLTIRILPPLWRTWWAYLLYITTITVVAYKVIQFFRIRTRLEHDLYNEHLHNERQQEFYKMKLDFFTNISHELRTPLTLILSPVENLYKQTQDNPKLNRQILHIKNNAERLLRLIGELMDFRKAETGNMVLYLQRDNIVPFIKEIYLSFLPVADSRNICYEFVSPEEEIFLYSDHDQLEKVFFNLLSNAFKFTPDNGKIKMEISLTDQNYVSVSVTDNGKGIPESAHDKLFTNFYQVDPDKSHKGTGVGLALSKRIVELHNGNITLISQPATHDAPGHTVFNVQIPYQNVASENVHLVPDDLINQNIATYKLQSEIDVFTDSVFKEGDRRYTVYLAEDNDELRAFITESLPNYEIVAFTNGATAFESAVEKIPDLVISDVMMPEMNGLDLCRKLKTDDRTSHIPVILLTALASHIHQVNGFQTGADAYLTKPFSTRLLELNAHNLLSSREIMRKKFPQQMPLSLQNASINSADEKFLKKLIQVIEDNMENPEFGVVALGQEIGMSKSVLFKKICALTDLSPLDFLKSVRLQKAATLLRQKEYHVNEVAYLVGFNDPKWFSREFKKQFGKTPSEMMELG